MTTREELEAAIHTNPDDPAGYPVLADWLVTQHDPLGELIVMHAQDKTAEAQGLLEEKREDFYGPLADFLIPMANDRVRDRKLELEWFMGFVKRAHVGWETFTKKSRTQAAAEFAAFLALPITRSAQRGSRTSSGSRSGSGRPTTAPKATSRRSSRSSKARSSRSSATSV